MTKERKLAIEMWEFIVEHWDKASVYRLKERFANSCDEIIINWQNNCWFCEYCRRDHRYGHPGREDIDRRTNNCECCPLYKYEIAHGNYPTEDDACGCASDHWHKEPLFARAQLGHSKEAAEIILKLLKGEEV